MEELFFSQSLLLYCSLLAVFSMNEHVQSIRKVTLQGHCTDITGIVRGNLKKATYVEVISGWPTYLLSLGNRSSAEVIRIRAKQTSQK